jgi:hypothetical protein
MECKLTKSKFQAFAEYPKQLWLITDPPREESINQDDASELLMAHGLRFGRAVEGCFPSGIEIAAKEPREAITEAQSRLKEFTGCNRRASLFEAEFGVDDVLVRIDVLAPLADGSRSLTEVKSGVLWASYRSCFLMITSSPPRSKHFGLILSVH